MAGITALLIAVFLFGSTSGQNSLRDFNDPFSNRLRGLESGNAIFEEP
jgi:hypothetical protein